MKQFLIILLVLFSFNSNLKIRDEKNEERGYKVYIKRCKKDHDNLSKVEEMRKRIGSVKLFG